jgi:hypothetical protein
MFKDEMTNGEEAREGIGEAAAGGHRLALNKTSPKPRPAGSRLHPRIGQSLASTPGQNKGKQNKKHPTLHPPRLQGPTKKWEPPMSDRGNKIALV